MFCHGLVRPWPATKSVDGEAGFIECIDVLGRFPVNLGVLGLMKEVVKAVENILADLRAADCQSRCAQWLA